MKALWNGRIIAESDETLVVESNHYFPKSSILPQYFQKSDTTTHCPWKGDAQYFSLVVEGEKNADAAWYYAAPKQAAIEIEDMVAFWHGVEITA